MTRPEHITTNTEMISAKVAADWRHILLPKEAARQKRERERKKKKKKKEGKMNPVQALSDLTGDQLITSEFRNSHVRRTSPDRAEAVKVAKDRNRTDNTMIFLRKDEFYTLLEDIRAAHKSWWQPGGKPRDRQLFQTKRMYNYIQVKKDAQDNQFKVTHAARGYVHFAVKSSGSIEVDGRQYPVFAMHHLEPMRRAGPTTHAPWGDLPTASASSSSAYPSSSSASSSSPTQSFSADLERDADRDERADGSAAGDRVDR